MFTAMKIDPSSSVGKEKELRTDETVNSKLELRPKSSYTAKEASFLQTYVYLKYFVFLLHKSWQH